MNESHIPVYEQDYATETTGPGADLQIAFSQDENMFTNATLNVAIQSDHDTHTEDERESFLNHTA